MTGGVRSEGTVSGWEILAGMGCTEGCLKVGVRFVGKTVGDVVLLGLEAAGRFRDGTFTVLPGFTGRVGGGRMLGKSATRRLGVLGLKSVGIAIAFGEKLPPISKTPRKLRLPNCRELI